MKFLVGFIIFMFSFTIGNSVLLDSTEFNKQKLIDASLEIFQKHFNKTELTFLSNKINVIEGRYIDVLNYPLPHYCKAKSWFVKNHSDYTSKKKKYYDALFVINYNNASELKKYLNTTDIYEYPEKVKLLFNNNDTVNQLAIVSFIKDKDKIKIIRYQTEVFLQEYVDASDIRGLVLDRK